MAELDAMGIQKPTPIQALAIGPVLEGRDVIAKAETGTGKTLAFGAPILARLDPSRTSILALLLCPTRELAQQVADVLQRLGKVRGLNVALVVGGEPMQPQVKALRSGAQVVVATPGRIIDLYEQRFVTFPWTEFVVLDEADRMLEIGFLDDVKKILNFLPKERQTLLFSATFPPDLLRLAREHTQRPIEVATALGTKTAANVEQFWIPVGEDERSDAVARLIATSHPDAIFIVFCKKRTDVGVMYRRLRRLPNAIHALHGGFDQAARFQVMEEFRSGKLKALIATDVAARGLDISHVTDVVNAFVPFEATEYAHRVGRTGRAGRSGRAVTLVAPSDRRKWMAIRGKIGADVQETTLDRIAPFGSQRPQRRPSSADSAPPTPAPRRPPQAERTPRERPRSTSAQPTDGFGAMLPTPQASRTAGHAQPARRQDERTPPRGASGSTAGRSSQSAARPLPSQQRETSQRPAQPQQREPMQRREPPQRPESVSRQERAQKQTQPQNEARTQSQRIPGQAQPQQEERRQRQTPSQRRDLEQRREEPRRREPVRRGAQPQRQTPPPPAPRTQAPPPAESNERRSKPPRAEAQRALAKPAPKAAPQRPAAPPKATAERTEASDSWLQIAPLPQPAAAAGQRAAAKPSTPRKTQSARSKGPVPGKPERSAPSTPIAPPEPVKPTTDAPRAVKKVARKSAKKVAQPAIKKAAKKVAQRATKKAPRNSTKKAARKVASKKAAAKKSSSD